jgi:hypothetical protein
MFTYQRKPARTPAGDHEQPHPFVGRAAVFAIIVAMLAIVWAKVEVLGTRDIERTLTEEEATLAQVCADRLEAVAFNRWATGFSQ